MKTNSFVRCATAALAAMAVVAWLPAARAAEPLTGKGGATQLFKPIETMAQIQSLKPGDQIAMSCPKCKTVTVTIVTQDTKHMTKVLPGEKHLCPGCSREIEVVGHGKDKKEIVRHVCKACGSESAFCCVTTKGEGPTKGMEKKPKAKK